MKNPESTPPSDRTAASQGASTLDSLRESFARFRAENQARARFPDALRNLNYCASLSCGNDDGSRCGSALNLLLEESEAITVEAVKILLSARI